MWFPAGGGETGGGQAAGGSSSLLADWNSYAAETVSGEEGSAGGFVLFDIESAVCFANDVVSGTFTVTLFIERSEIEYPGAYSLPPAAFLPEKLVCFGSLLAAGVSFIFIALSLFLPVIVLVPQKFAICFTLGCCFVIGAFVALKGPQNQFSNMTSTERFPLTLGFLGSVVCTIYVPMVLHSYILSVLFSAIQILALAYYVISYFLGGSAGMKFFSSSLV